MDTIENESNNVTIRLADRRRIVSQEMFSYASSIRSIRHEFLISNLPLGGRSRCLLGKLQPVELLEWARKQMPGDGDPHMKCNYLNKDRRCSRPIAKKTVAPAPMNTPRLHLSAALELNDAN